MCCPFSHTVLLCSLRDISPVLKLINGCENACIKEINSECILRNSECIPVHIRAAYPKYKGLKRKPVMALNCAFLTVRNVLMPTENIFLCVALLFRGLWSKLANHWAQAKLQLTQQACKLRVKCWSPPLILRRSERQNFKTSCSYSLFLLCSGTWNALGWSQIRSNHEYFLMFTSSDLQSFKYPWHFLMCNDRLTFSSTGANTCLTAWYRVLMGESNMEDTRRLWWRLSSVITVGCSLKNTNTFSLLSPDASIWQRKANHLHAFIKNQFKTNNTWCLSSRQNWKYVHWRAILILTEM